MAYTQILYDVADGVATITLNRPDKMNAFTETMCAELIAAIDAVDADDNVRAAIITGAGRAFCAGADLSAGADTFNYEKDDNSAIDWQDEKIRDNGGLLTLRLYECKKPLIAAINGAAVGVGVTMTLAMDVRIASDKARFGFVFARRGIVPEAASSWFLPRIVGIEKALEWCFSGRVFDATEAKEGRLVSRVVAADDLYATALAFAREIADNTAPVSVALTRQMLWRMLGESHPMAAHRVDSAAVFARGRTADAAEGVTSFLEKRTPRYPDKVSTGMPGFFPWWPQAKWR